MIINSTIIFDLVKNNKRKSESLFPKLIEKLVKASINKNGYIRFPSGDAIFTPGADGILSNVISTSCFVPSGNSFWEIGTNGDALGKIKGNYEKRKIEEKGLKKEEYSYVSVTSAIINSTDKQSFCDQESLSGPFKAVLVIDANDISSWMEHHIEICIWFLQQYDKKIEGYDIILVKDEWDYISNSTTPALTSNTFLLGNESNAEKFLDDINTQKKNKIYTISSQYYGREHAYCFCVAALLSTNNDNITDNGRCRLYRKLFCKAYT